MEELKAMITAIMNSLIEMTTRAIKAEEMEAALRANIEKAQNDVEYWKAAWRGTSRRLADVETELETLKEKQNDTEGS